MIYNVEKAGYILLGRCGESHARMVEIDVSSYLEEWPDGAVTLLHRRHGEETIYPVASELQGGHLIWVPSSADTTYAGDGEAEVRVTVGGTVVKSKILHTVVEKSLTGQEVDTPEASKDWVDKVLEKVGDMTEVKAEAESIEYGQPAKAEYDKETGTLKLSIPEGKPGKDGQNGSQGPQGPQGDPGKDGTDAEVTSENIQSALGYTPVKDVQIAGTSILADGVANVPVASEATFGAVKVFDWGGTLIDSNKRLCVFPSSANHISNRQSRTVIVPENLDTAVKAAMCDGKGAAWTSAEQAAARSRMGLDKQYELIEEIVLEEGAAVQRSNEPDGTPYKLRRVLIDFISPGASGDIAISQLVYVGNEFIYNYGVKTIGLNAGAESVLYADVENGNMRLAQVFVRSKTDSLYEANTPRDAYKIVSGDAITSISLSEMPIGTTVKIYGVRA